MVCIRNTNRKSAIERGGRRHGNSLLLELEQNFLIKTVQCIVRQPGPHITKASDVQRRRRKQLQLFRFAYSFHQIVNVLDILFDHARNLLHAMSFEMHPDFQCLEIAREIYTQIRKRQPAGSHAALRYCEIRRRGSKRRTMQSRVAHQNAGSVKRQIDPLVEIKADRVCPLYSHHKWLEPGRNSRPRAKGSVNVKPGVMLLRDVRQRFKIINRSRIHGSSRANNAYWTMTFSL